MSINYAHVLHLWAERQSETADFASELLKTYSAVVFRIPEVSQFYIKFEAYVRS